MDIERGPVLISSEEDPLLSTSIDKRPKAINLQNWLYPHTHFYFDNSREKVRHHLSSKVGHYSVLGLVVLDTSCIFADFVIRLFKCEKAWGDKGWDESLEALSIIGLIFSTLFLIELILAVWAFGWSYFKSRFHRFDAIVIVAGFSLDVALRGPLEEAASLIIVLRFWRVFKIIEELTVGAQEQIDGLSGQITVLEEKNAGLRQEIVDEKYGREKEVGELRRRLESSGNGGSREINRSETPPTPD